jgi:hypothetical protein
MTTTSSPAPATAALASPFGALNVTPPTPKEPAPEANQKRQRQIVGGFAKPSPGEIRAMKCVADMRELVADFVYQNEQFLDKMVALSKQLEETPEGLSTMTSMGLDMQTVYALQNRTILLLDAFFPYEDQ